MPFILSATVRLTRGPSTHLFCASAETNFAQDDSFVFPAASRATHSSSPRSDRLAHSATDFKLHLAVLGVDDYVITVQHFAVEDLQRQRILN
jgi:hypothetical protein